jgi:TP901 family phage tail tape measure protein
MAEINNTVGINIVTDDHGSPGIFSRLVGWLDRTGESTDGLTRKQRKLQKATEELNAATDALIASEERLFDTEKALADSLEREKTLLDGATAATEELASASETATKPLEEEAAALDAVNKAAERFIGQQQGMALGQARMASAAEANLSRTQRSLNRWEAQGTPALMRAGSIAALGVGGLVYESVKKYADFNKRLTQAAAESGMSVKRLPQIQKGLLDISKTTGQSANDLADAMYRVNSATASWHNGLGASNKELLGLTKQVSQLSVLGNIPAGKQQEQAARVIGAFSNANLIGTGRDPAKVAALINATAGSGDIRPAEIISSVGRGLLTSAKLNKIKASDAMAWVDLMTSFGATGSIAGTQVTHGMNLLFNPSEQGMKAERMMGINIGDMSRVYKQGYGGMTGLEAVSKFFNDKMQRWAPAQNYGKYGGKTGPAGAQKQFEAWTAGGFSAEDIKKWQSGTLGAKKLQDMQTFMLTKIFGGAKQLIPVATLLTEGNTLHGLVQAINKRSTPQAYQKALNVGLNTPQVQLNKIKASITADLINIGQTLLPIVVTVGKGLAALVGFFAKFKVALYGLLGVATTLIALAVRAKLATFANQSLLPFIGKYTFAREERLRRKGYDVRPSAATMKYQERLEKINFDYAKSMARNGMLFSDAVTEFADVVAGEAIGGGGGRGPRGRGRGPRGGGPRGGEPVSPEGEAVAMSRREQRRLRRAARYTGPEVRPRGGGGHQIVGEGGRFGRAAT